MSTPRPAKSEPISETQAAFCWTFPGAPIRVNMPLSLISRLRAELDRHENSGYRSPSLEVGGVLLGHRVTRTTLEIDDYLWVSSEARVSSEEQPAGRYRVDTSALERLREEYPARIESTHRSQIVGFFRTQADDDLQVRDQEIGLVREHFRDSADVVLLIRTSDEPYTAGFLFWMTEGNFTPFSLMDFPLDPGLLQARAISSVALQPAKKAEMKRSWPAIPDEDSRTLAESASTSGAKPISAPDDDVSFNLRLKSRPDWRQERPSISDAGEKIERPQPAPAVHHLHPGTGAPPRQEPARVSLRRVLAFAAVFALLAVAGLSAFLLRGRWSAALPQKALAKVVAFPLQLDVEAQGEGLNVRWNPQSAPIVQAREGHLTIVEVDQQPPRIIPLDVQQLMSGHIYYRSSAERVQFQLEVVDNTGGVSRESVLALSSKPAPVAARGAAPQAGNVQSPARIVESIRIPVADPGAVSLANSEEAPASRQPASRVFAAPPSSRDRAAQVPVIALDQPPAISTNGAPPPTVVLPATLSNLPVSNPPAPQVKEPPAALPPPAPRQIRVDSLQPANLIKKVDPAYPPMAMSMHIQGTVRFTATIGRDGAVRSLKLISGNAALVQAATDAVKQWRYRPTLLNGDPVEGVTQIDVAFTLNR